MSLVSVAEVRARIRCSLDDENLQALIDAIEAEITRRIGPPQNDAGTVVHTVSGYGEGDVFFLPGEAAEIVAVEEDNQPLSADEWRYYAGGVLERQGARQWFGMVEVSYRPVDDRAARKQAILDLLRLHLERTAMAEENIGEYRYKAPVWDEEARRIIRRIVWRGV